MEKLTVKAYAEKMGISFQAVHRSITSGKVSRLKGVTQIEEIQSVKSKIYVLHYNPEHNENNSN